MSVSILFCLCLHASTLILYYSYIISSLFVTMEPLRNVWLEIYNLHIVYTVRSLQAHLFSLIFVVSANRD